MKISKINNLFNISPDKNLYSEINKILSQIINFKYLCINFEKQECFGEKKQDFQYISEDLKYRNAKFGEIEIGNESFSQNDIECFKICAGIISNVIKDNEISKIMKMQVEALQEGYLKVKNAEEAKTNFISHMSHELRTPLNSILGFADILEFAGKLNKKQKEYINDIKASGISLLGMINEILDMSKLEANAMKIVKSKFFISRAIDEATNIIMPIAHKKGVKITKSIIEDFEVFADYQKIQQILYNLLSNAVKYSPENDEVEITVFNGKESFRIAVHDNGIGIDKKYHGKIFAKFVQLDSAYTKKESSTGLGLTITKELVELHNGKITLISEVNNGSTFIVEIPN